MTDEAMDRRRHMARHPWWVAGILSLSLALTLGCSPGGSVTGGKGEPLVLDAAQMKVEAEKMLSTSDTLDRHRRMVELMDALNEGNLSGAIEAYESNLSRVDPHEIRLFTNAWAQIDPRGALDRILDTWRYPKINNQAVLEVVTIWVQSGDAQAARAYVDPNFDSPFPSRASPTRFMVLAVLQSLAVEGEYEELTGMLASLEDDADRELFITEVMVEMNRARGKGKVKAWVDSVPWDTPKNLKFSTMKRGLDWIARMSGPQSAKWFEEIEDHPRSIELLPMAVKSWGVRDPGAAILWLADRQSTTVQAALVREIGRGWLQREGSAEEAEVWIRDHIEMPLVRDHLSLVLANHLVNEKKWEESIAMASLAPTALQRDHAIASVFREWSTYDDGALEAFIASGEVSESAIETYRKRTAENPIKVKRVRQGQAKKQLEEKG